MSRSAGLWQVPPKDRRKFLCIERVSEVLFRVTRTSSGGIMLPER